jgi:putative transposase
MRKHPGSSALRKGRVSLHGQIYLVTSIALRREPRFAEWDQASHACRALADPRVWRNSRLLCWVLMPDHWHAIVQLGGEDSLSLIVNRAKAAIAKATNASAGGAGRVWERGFHDHALRREENLLEVARYVVANPIRASLVRSVGNYPYWDAVWL